MIPFNPLHRHVDCQPYGIRDTREENISDLNHTIQCIVYSLPVEVLIEIPNRETFSPSHLLKLKPKLKKQQERLAV